MIEGEDGDVYCEAAICLKIRWILKCDWDLGPGELLVYNDLKTRVEPLKY